ncbi:MAG TPA: alpha/beta hydrolase [Devosia sp.]|nr:alpha/beta hydrolase [Devosia sp.]
MRRILVAATWIGGFLLAFTTAIIVAFAVSPWPSVFLISMAFAGNDAGSESALEKHVPAGLTVHNDVAYAEGPDEVLDLVLPADVGADLPVVLWVHGGGYIGGSKDGVANYLKILAAQGFAVAGMNYSTAPGATYPTPVRQVAAALQFLTDDSQNLRIDANRIVLAGDSAGAQIAAQAALIVTDPEYAAAIGIEPSIRDDQLKGTVLVSGAFDMTALDVVGGIEGWFVKTVLWSYSGVRDFMNDEQFQSASITPNVSSNFPPTFITSGDADPLEPQARALYRKLKELGVDVEALFFDAGPRLQHEYQFNLDTVEGQEAFRRSVSFIKRVTH